MARRAGEGGRRGGEDRQGELEGGRDEGAHPWGRMGSSGGGSLVSCLPTSPCDGYAIGSEDSPGGKRWRGAPSAAAARSNGHGAGRTKDRAQRLQGRTFVSFASYFDAPPPIVA